MCFSPSILPHSAALQSQQVWTHIVLLPQFFLPIVSFLIIITSFYLCLFIMTSSSSSRSITTLTAQQHVYFVTNVYNQFSFKLTSDGSKYKLWCYIFKYICTCVKFIGNITDKSKPIGEDDEDWVSIDSRVKSWFYSTCDPSVLQVITTNSCTSKDMWDNLHEYFLNSKMPRMLQLQEQFHNTKMVHLPFMGTVIYSNTLQIPFMILTLKVLNWNL